MSNRSTLTTELPLAGIRETWSRMRVATDRIQRPLVDSRPVSGINGAMLAAPRAPMAIGNKTGLTTLALGVGFTVLAVANALGWITKDPSTELSYIIRWQALNYGIGFLASLALFYSYARIEKKLRPAQLGIAAVLLCFFLGMAWRFTAGVLMWYLGINATFKLGFAMLVIRGGLIDGSTLGLVSFIYFAIEHQRRASEQAERARRATALAHQAQLQMLRYQLNPHFLFNALNSIRGMIIEDPVRSREMVAQLADFLRYSLNGKQDESTIASEVEAIENYLAIQRIRFEDRLDATVTVDDNALNAYVPCFLIHPLVENAVKYGMKTSEMPLRLRILVARQGESLRIEVANSGKLQPEAQAAGLAPEGTGIGLKNISERLQLVYPDRHEFRIWEEDGWVRAQIDVQLGTPEDKIYEAAYGTHRR